MFTSLCTYHDLIVGIPWAGTVLIQETAHYLLHQAVSMNIFCRKFRHRRGNIRFRQPIGFQILEITADEQDYMAVCQRFLCCVSSRNAQHFNSRTFEVIHPVLELSRLAVLE